MTEQKRKKKNVALFLAVFPWTGCLGFDRFYLGDWVNGILKAITCGGFFIMYVKDIIRIVHGEQTDKNGNPLEDRDGEPCWPNTGLKKEALLSESAEVRLSALDRVMASYGVYSHYSEATVREGVRETARETFRAAALNDPDGENRLHAARLLEKAGTVNDWAEVLEQSRDPKVRVLIFLRFASRELDWIAVHLDGSPERVETEEKFGKAVRSYFCEENQGFSVERLQAYLDEAKLKEDRYRLFRDLVLTRTETADILRNPDGTWTEAGNGVRKLLKTDEELVRGKLCKEKGTVSLIIKLRDMGVPGARELLQLCVKDSLTEEQKKVLAELPEDMVKAMLWDEELSDTCVTALHGSPKWKEYVEANVPRVRVEVVGIKTIHNQDDDRFDYEEEYQCFERW